MTYIMSCVWLDYMVKYFQCKNCVGSSPKTKKCVASFLVPGDKEPAIFFRKLPVLFVLLFCLISVTKFMEEYHNAVKNSTLHKVFLYSKPLSIIR